VVGDKPSWLEKILSYGTKLELLNTQWQQELTHDMREIQPTCDRHWAAEIAAVFSAGRDAPALRQARCPPLQALGIQRRRLTIGGCVKLGATQRTGRPNDALISA
jgi:hypothetical protein